MEDKKKKDIYTKYNIPWIEKYRPKKIEDLAISDNIYNKLKKIIDSKELYNIIITGPPGVGKTSSGRCIGKALLKKYYKEGMIDLNASDERGIKVVQETIKDFCKKSAKLDDTEEEHKMKYKIVLLDEADNMTEKAQIHINLLMEKFSGSVRFIFTCNDSSKIIENIQSKCIIMYYGKLDNKTLSRRLINICKLENIDYDEEGIKAILEISQGDARTAINKLQQVYITKNKITYDDVYAVIGISYPVVIRNILKNCQEKDFGKVIKDINSLKIKGFTDLDIIILMFNILKSEDCEISEDIKIKFLDIICKTEYIMANGLDNELQLSNCLVKLILK
jgi:replication factor C subunit 2/4